MLNESKTYYKYHLGHHVFGYEVCDEDLIFGICTLVQQVLSLLYLLQPAPPPPPPPFTHLPQTFSYLFLTHSLSLCLPAPLPCHPLPMHMYTISLIPPPCPLSLAEKANARGLTQFLCLLREHMALPTEHYIIFRHHRDRFLLARRGEEEEHGRCFWPRR